MNDPEMPEILRRYKVIILPNSTRLTEHECRLFDDYVRSGGHLIATYRSGLGDEGEGAAAKFGLTSLGVTELETMRDNMRSAYFRIAKGEFDFPATQLILLDQGYLYSKTKPGSETRLHLIPPQRYGPPEKCYPDLETDRPGVIFYRYGQGETAYLPWQPDSLYYRHSLDEHRRLIQQLINRYDPQPLIVTDAPPQVEITVHHQEEKQRILIHAVNFSGNQGTSYHEPIPIQGLRIGIRLSKANVHKIQALVSGQSLTPLTMEGTSANQDGSELKAPFNGDYLWFEVPLFKYFEAIAIEQDDYLI